MKLIKAAQRQSAQIDTIIKAIDGGYLHGFFLIRHVLDETRKRLRKAIDEEDDMEHWRAASSFRRWCEDNGREYCPEDYKTFEKNAKDYEAYRSLAMPTSEKLAEALMGHKEAE